MLDFARRTLGEATGRGNRATQRPKLDIDLSYWMNSANQIFNDLTGGFERGMSRPAEFNDGDDSGTNRSAKGFGGAVDHRNSAPNPGKRKLDRLELGSVRFGSTRF